MQFDWMRTSTKYNQAIVTKQNSTKEDIQSKNIIEFLSFAIISNFAQSSLLTQYLIQFKCNIGYNKSLITCIHVLITEDETASKIEIIYI